MIKYISGFCLFSPKVGGPKVRKFIIFKRTAETSFGLPVYRLSDLILFI
jgi:hypothetical protein